MTPVPQKEEEDLISASVIGLKDLENHYVCVNCNKPAVTPTDEHTGVCDNYNITQKLTSKQTTKLIITAGETRITLKAIDDAIREIAQCKPDATKVFLKSSSLLLLSTAHITNSIQI